MIYCSHAKQSINLSYSVIKFLEFSGFTWAGDSLSFKINSIGELMQSRLEVREQDGERLAGARWERGQLFGPFRNDRLYDLSARLEYGLPLSATEYKSDFLSICPKQYEVALDFIASQSSDTGRRVEVRLHERSWIMDTDQPTEMQLDTGEWIRVFREHEFRGVSVSAKSDVPFSHRSYPSFSLV